MPNSLGKVGLASVILCMFGLGCGITRFYDGAARPKDQVAVIKPSGILNVAIAGVDGRSSGYFDRDVEVLPGPHEVMVRFKQGTNTAERPVSFNAEAGRIYQVKASGAFLAFPFKSDFSFWIVDSETDAVVGGKKPQ